MRKLFVMMTAMVALLSCNGNGKSGNTSAAKEEFDTLYAGYAGMQDLNSKDWPYCEYGCIMDDWGTKLAEIHKYVFDNKVIYIDTVPGKEEDFEMYEQSYIIKKVAEGRWIVSYKRYLKEDKTFEIKAQ